MALLHFSDILIKAGLDPARVQLIRHAMSDKDFRACYEKNMEKESGLRCAEIWTSMNSLSTVIIHHISKDPV